MRSSFAFLALVAGLCGCGVINGSKKAPGGGGDGVNNGGDPVHYLIENAWRMAPNIVRDFNAAYLDPSWEPSVTQWVTQNKEALATDIINTPRVWTDDSQQYCALTQGTKAAQITFSFPVCRGQLVSNQDAVSLLIHESVHHLGFPDQDFPDNVATAVVTAWLVSDQKLAGGSNPPTATGPADPPDATVAISGGTVVNSLMVNLQVTANGAVSWIKFSEDKDFLNVHWSKAAPAATYTFQTPGPKVLYYMVANPNYVPSSPFSLNLTIDLFAQNGVPFVPDFTVKDPSETYPVTAFQVNNIVVAPAAKKMQVSFKDDFAGAAWVEPAPVAALSLPQVPASCGDHEIYLRFATTDDIPSASGSKQVSVQCPAPTRG
jgi:hypothetical protein